jgi:hypothetical protein
MRFYLLTLGILAVWRITHLLNAEDGPWDLLVRFRRLAGEGVWGSLLDCFYCLSVWVAAPLAYGLGNDWKERFLLWPALSGGAILAERLTANRGRSEPPPAVYYEESEENPDVLRQQERTIPGTTRAR